MLAAAIRAKPLETPPQLESCARQRGAHSRIGFVGPLRHRGALLGRALWCIQRRMTMPTNKDLKRLVRARMKKTGEAYTAARAHIIRKPKAKPVSKAASGSTPLAATKPADFAAIAGMSDDKIKAKTGCTWERWVYALDRRGAEKMSHGDIAALVNEKYKVNGWWSQ